MKGHDRRGIYFGILSAGDRCVMVSLYGSTCHPETVGTLFVWPWDDKGPQLVLELLPRKKNR